jgi:hypothetical protein
MSLVGEPNTTLDVICRKSVVSDGDAGRKSVDEHCDSGQTKRTLRRREVIVTRWVRHKLSRSVFKPRSVENYEARHNYHCILWLIK